MVMLCHRVGRWDLGVASGHERDASGCVGRWGHWHAHKVHIAIGLRALWAGKVECSHCSTAGACVRQVAGEEGMMGIG
jgi:hypothetical protein